MRRAATAAKAAVEIDGLEFVLFLYIQRYGGRTSMIKSARRDDGWASRSPEPSKRPRSPDAHGSKDDADADRDKAGDSKVAAQRRATFVVDNIAQIVMLVADIGK